MNLSNNIVIFQNNNYFFTKVLKITMKRNNEKKNINNLPLHFLFKIIMDSLQLPFSLYFSFNFLYIKIMSILNQEFRLNNSYYLNLFLNQGCFFLNN